jgi:hypothetical protein
MNTPRQFKAIETCEPLLTKGKIYKEIKPYSGDQGCIWVVDDIGREGTFFKERFEEIVQQGGISKPPLGLRPEFIILEHRQKEIQEAAIRYMEAGLAIPSAWTAEYYRNNSRLLEIK